MIAYCIINIDSNHLKALKRKWKSVVVASNDNVIAKLDQLLQ